MIAQRKLLTEMVNVDILLALFLEDRFGSGGISI